MGQTHGDLSFDTPHLFCDIVITRIDTVSEQILCAAIAATEVAVVEKLPVRKAKGKVVFEREVVGWRDIQEHWKSQIKKLPGLTFI